MGEETPRVETRGARAFDATLSVPGREELKQTGMRVRVVPAPAWTPRASHEAAEAGETNARGAGAAGTSAPNAPVAADAETKRKNDARARVFEPPPDAWSTPVTPDVLGTMTVIGFWEPGRGLDPLGALHLIAGARGPSARLVATPTPAPSGREGNGDEGNGDARSPKTLEGVEALHAELSEKSKTAVVSIAGGRREVHLCAVPADGVSDETTFRDDARARAGAVGRDGFHFLAFETRAMAPFHHAPILAQKQLAVIFDLDETLLQAFTLSSLDRRADAVRRAHESAEDDVSKNVVVPSADEADVATDAAGKTVAGALGASPAMRTGDRGPVDARAARQRREEDMARLKHDRAMLAQYVAENCVTDGRGRRHAAAAESAVTAPGEVTFRPVIRLPSPHCRGGQMIFTRIDPANVGTSMLVHVRPGWEELHAYLAGLDRRGGGGPERAAARCAAFVCTMSEPRYAQEMWRLLDPRGALIAPKDLAHKVVSVKQGAELKTLEKAVGPWGVAKSLCVVLDDRTAVWDPRARPHILAVAPFMPYATDTGPGLRGEAPGEAGVLGAARRMLDKTRMDLFMTYERFARFHARHPNAPFEPPASALTPQTARDAEASARDEARDADAEETDAAAARFETSRPQPPDVGETLPPLMNAHAKEAVREVAQMGGAARSAAGAGSRLNAMLGGIAAPRVAGAVKTLASASFGKSAGVSHGGPADEKRNASGSEMAAGADDAARKKARAAAAAAIKLAAEEKARERAERRATNDPAAGEGGEEGEGDGDGPEGPAGVDSDEERVRKEDARAEAALGESSESDSEPDERVKASARAPGDAPATVAKETNKAAPRKPRNTCLTCAAKGLTPTDHFRFCKACPFHPDHKSEKREKPSATEESPAADERALASERSKSDPEAAHEAGERGLAAPEESGGEKRKGSSRSPLKPTPKPVWRAKEAQALRDGGDAGRDLERDSECDLERDSEEAEDVGDDTTAGKRKRRDEKAWSPPPEVTAESEMPAAKPLPSKPNAKKQRVSQKSQREAILKKLSGKRR